MTSVVLVGRLVADAEKSATSNGGDFIRFRVACDGAGNSTDDPGFFQVAHFPREGKGGVFPYLLKGTQVAVTGTLQQRNYEKDGEKVYAVGVRAFNIQLIGSKGGNAQTASEAAAQRGASARPEGASEAQTAQEAEDEIPF